MTVFATEMKLLNQHNSLFFEVDNFFVRNYKIDVKKIHLSGNIQQQQQQQQKAAQSINENERIHDCKKEGKNYDYTTNILSNIINLAILRYF